MNVKKRGGGGQFQLRKVGGRVKKVGNLCARLIRQYDSYFYNLYQALRVETANKFYFSAYIIRLRHKVADSVV